MKKRLFLSMLITMGILTAFLSSCKKDKDDDKETTPKLYASFNVAGDYRPSPGTVVFTNTSTNAISYLWDFGDGTTSEEANPQHVYTAAGDYEVVLTAKASDGTTDTYSATVTMLGACTKLEVKTLFVYKEAVTQGNGTEWDTDGTGADIYFKILDQNMNVVVDLGSYWIDVVFDDSVTTAVSFSATDFDVFPFTLNSISSNYIIQVFDYDPESSDSELMCETTFKPEDFIPTDTLQSYPATYTIESPKIGMNFNWTE